MLFLGVYKALYAYEPQSDQELAVDENDILYLLEKSDVDDWWTVKKRVVGPDVDEPVGLVPSNYIEPADSIATATALFDYDRQTDEEVSFKEGDSFQVFDDKDPDWVLVSKNGNEFGFIPSNYIEVRSGTAVPSAAPIGILPPPPSHPSLATSSAQATAQPVSSFQPPPQRYDREPAQDDEYNDEEESVPALPSKPRPQSEDYSRRDSYASSNHRDTYNDYEAPPAKPSRPGSGPSSRRGSRAVPEDAQDDQLYTWSVSEVDGRKKKKAMFAIGNGTIYFSPDSVNGGPQQWKAKDLLSFSSEKKHLFLEFKDPLYSLELHTGTKEVAAEILTVLGELKGAISSRELSEVKSAASSKGSKKQGKILYGFEAEGNDELTVKEGEVVYIINDTKSTDWWLVQNKSGHSGVVPSQFVSPVKEQSALFSLGSKFKLGRSKSKDNLKESPKKQREQREQEDNSKKLSTPKQSRIRTWEDRSGTFKVDAEFLGVVDGKIHLHKTNGVKIGVAANKLSLTDLEYVERVTGMSLESFKGTKSKSKPSSEERERRERKERERKRREREEREKDMSDMDRARDRERRERDREALERERDRKERELERREREMDREERDRLHRELDEAKRKLRDLDDIKRQINDTPPAQPTRPASNSTSHRATSSGAKAEDYDWFEFFLESGVDVNQCQRYSNNFSNEQIDPSILESIDAAVLRTLGLREGDIIRVTRHIDQKFGRQPKESQAANGSLFSEQGGALKVNRTGSSNQVSSSLPVPSQGAPSTDDDAWTVKPAANTATSAKSTPLQTQQFTGSMQDLVNLKPLEPTKTSSSIKSQTYAPTPSKPLEPSTTGYSMNPQKTGNITAQPTGIALDPFKTGGGNLLPLATGGFVYLPVQQTGIIGMQTGLMPLQKTGGLVPLQRTGGLNTAPTGGLVPLQKTGGIQPMPLQRTGGMASFTTGGIMPAALTGGMPTTSFGLPTTSFGATPGSMPITSFGSTPATMPTSAFGQAMMAQRTGGMNPMLTGMNPMLTGMNPMSTGFNGMPQASFPSQPTGGLPQASFPSQITGGLPQRSFGTNLMMNNSFPSQQTGMQFQPQFSTNSLSSPPTFNTGAPTNGFNQQMNGLTNQFMNTSISQPQFQQPFNTGFQQMPQQMPTFGGFAQQPQQQMPQPTFGQPMQPLEAQPTGFGFGNTPAFGSSGKADLSKATAENPFGF